MNNPNTNPSVLSCISTPYDLIADRYDDLFGDDNLYYAPVTHREREVFEAYVQDGRGNRDALDIGCGTGLNTQWLAEKGYRVVGIDKSREMLRVAEAKGREWRRKPELLLGDAMNMHSLGARTFDVVTCLGSTLNHVDDWERLFAQVSRRLRKGGRFIFSFDNNSLLESVFWLLRRKHGAYEAKQRGAIFRERIRCCFQNLTFRNHWKMKDKNISVVVPLTYETVKICNKKLLACGMRIELLQGVHLLSYLAPSIVTASVNLEPPSRPGVAGLWVKLIQLGDAWLSKYAPSLSGNVIGVATKPD